MYSSNCSLKRSVQFAHHLFKNRSKLHTVLPLFSSEPRLNWMEQPLQVINAWTKCQANLLASWEIIWTFNMKDESIQLMLHIND